MNVSLTPALEKLVEKRVKSGLYHSASEVIREALRLLEDQERARHLKLENLRREISIGVEQADRGELMDGQEVIRKLRKRHTEQAQRKR